MLFLTFSCTHRVVHLLTRIQSTYYRCTLIRRKKPTTEFIFHFTATLSEVNKANIMLCQLGVVAMT